MMRMMMVMMMKMVSGYDDGVDEGDNVNSLNLSQSILLEMVLWLQRSQVDFGSIWHL